MPGFDLVVVAVVVVLEVVVLEVVVLEVELDPVKRPTTIVTVLFLSAVLPPEGLCEMTDPS